MPKGISQRVVERSLLYIRALSNLAAQGKEVVSSAELASVTGLSDGTVRKDISNFSRVGKPGVGYTVRDLKNVLEEYVLRDEVIHIALFGIGNLGRAILRYPGFQREKLTIVAGFDVRQGKIGQTVNGVRIHDIAEAERVMMREHADVAIVAVPGDAAQEVTDRVVSCGLKAVVNFSPAALDVPDGVFVKNMDFSMEFLSLYCCARGIKQTLD